MTSTASRSILESLLKSRKELLLNSVKLPHRHALLREIDSVLDRVSQGNYGRCAKCGEQIEWSTVGPNPLARHCIAHQTPDEREQSIEDNRIGVHFVLSPSYPFKRIRVLIGRGGMGEVYADKAFTGTSFEEMVKDTALASAFQSSLLPQPGLCFGQWETSYAYEPARNVSGDYCDLIPDTQNMQLFFFLGDGMGKGIVGSIISSLLLSLFRTIVTFGREETLHELVERANRLLCEEFCRVDCGCFATVIIGRAMRDGTLEIANAGHPPAFIVGPGQRTSLDSTGPPLGLFYTSTYETKIVRPNQGQALFMCTDGITEAQDRSGAEYGHDHLARVFEHFDGKSAEDLVSACLRDLNSFSAEGRINDDRTILVVRRM